MRSSASILISALVMCGLTVAANAQLVVWSQKFDSLDLGQYPPTQPIGGYPPPAMFIVAPGEGGTGRALRITFNVTNGQFLNMACATLEYPANGNTNTDLSKYTLAFDLAVAGDTPGFDMAISVFGPSSNPWLGGNPWSGDAGIFSISRADLPAADSPSTGSGYKHFSIPLNTAQGGGLPPSHLNPTDAGYGIAFGLLGPATITDSPESVYVDNITMTVETNLPPPPTMNVVSAKPGLRVFSQNHTATYNQEGFGTVDTNQSWVGVASPINPVSYAITFADFDTVNNYTFYAQFVQKANPGDPFGVYDGPNALVWSIMHQDSGFATAVSWKTNLPASGEPNDALSLTTTSTEGRGTWMLSFTDDTDGTVTAPDGTTGSFSLPPDAAAQFANPLTIDFGTAPNNTAGYGQWIDLSRLAITNVIDGSEYDDFTQDANLNTNLWNPGFSMDAGSLIQVSTNTPIWENWSVPDEGFGLATKASLIGGTNVWFSPSYYGSGVGVTPVGPTQMGPSNKWVLIPKACLPTADGTTNGPVSQTGFFRLQSLPPSR